MTPILEGLRTGAWRLVLVEPNDKMMLMGGFRFAGRVPNSEVFKEVRKGWDDMLSASPDATAALLAEIEGLRGALEVERGWLIELKGSTPSWATVNPNDPDDHWTDDSTKAIRFARAIDAQACIDWIGWTEAFPSEHIWCDARSTKDRPDV